MGLQSLRNWYNNEEDGILIVDDSSFSRKMLKDILIDAGYHSIYEAADGYEAIEKIREYRPNCVFLDETMPKLNGTETIPKLLEIDPNVNIIMCTAATGQQKLIEEANVVGAKDYILKPYKKENILRVLEVYHDHKKQKKDFQKKQEYVTANRKIIEERDFDELAITNEMMEAEDYMGLHDIYDNTNIDNNKISTSERRRRRIGDLLLEAGIITKEQLNEALQIQKTNGGKIGDILIENNVLDEYQIMEVLEFQLGVPFIDLNNETIPTDIQKLVPYQLVKRHHVVPVKLENDLLYVAMEDPLNFIAIEDLQMVTNYEIAPVISFKESITTTINRLYGNETTDKAIKEFQKASAINLQEIYQEDQSLAVDSAPIVRFVNLMIEQAVLEGASDIHIEPLTKEVRVRFRVDGKLKLAQSVPKDVQSAVVTRIKILSGLDIAEKRVPQDGRFDHKTGDKLLNLRVSVLPTVHGEKVVMRILDKTNFLIPKEKLGFTEENLDKFDQLLKNPHGIILITGPTGSGKSTTLYTMLHELNQVNDNIITVEDPVEYMIDGLNQVQVNTKAGLTFAGALRSFLRQDPDIIMLGEIRDSETADIALRAAITGHLVLSTLHTNDAVSTISRLADMGIPPYMIAVSLMGVISQRLVRRLCTHCASSYQPEEHELQLLGLPDGDYTFKQAEGCSYCNQSGYKGRIAVHEILTIQKGLRDLITQNASTNELKEYAIKNDMSTLKDECVRLLQEGITSFEEIMEIAYSQEYVKE